MKCHKETFDEEELCIYCSELEEYEQLDKLDPWYEAKDWFENSCEHCVQGFPQHELQSDKCPYCSNDLMKVGYIR